MKTLEASMSCSGQSSDSGHSWCGYGFKRGNQSPTATHPAKQSRVETFDAPPREATQPVFHRSQEDDDVSVSSEGEVSDPDDPEVIPMGKHKEEISKWEEKYEQLRKQYDKLRDTFNTVLKLNIKYQKHMVNCKNLNVPESVCVTPHSSSKAPWEDQAATYSSVHSTARQPAKEAQVPVTTPGSGTPARSALGLQLAAALRERLAANDHQDGGDQVPDPVPDGSSTPKQKDNGAAQPPRDHQGESTGDSTGREILHQAFMEIEEGCGYWVSANYWSDDHPFRTYVLAPPTKTHQVGERGDKIFIRDIASIFWTVDVLSKSSVSGRRSNANKYKSDADPGEKLDSRCIDDIEASLRWKVEKELARMHGSAWKQQTEVKAAFEKRVSRKTVNWELGQKINYIKKNFKRQAKKQEAIQQDQNISGDEAFRDE